MPDVLRILDCLLQADGFHIYLFTSQNRSEGHRGTRGTDAGTQYKVSRKDKTSVCLLR